MALPSVNQPAGIVSRAHTPAFNALLGRHRTASAAPSPFADNIIWQNRTFTWDPSLNPPALVPDVAAAPAVYWDLGVLGAAGQMNPVSGTLTSLAHRRPGSDGRLSGTNSTADPVLAGAYFNGARGIAVVDEFTVIQTAVAVDEGGNAIDVAFGPLTYTGAYTDSVVWGPERRHRRAVARGGSAAAEAAAAVGLLPVGRLRSDAAPVTCGYGRL